jgi:hypothetical protein
MDDLSIAAAARQLPANGLGNKDGKPARDVPPGEPWVFVEHRTMAEVIATERRP